MSSKISLFKQFILKWISNYKMFAQKFNIEQLQISENQSGVFTTEFPGIYLFSISDRSKFIIEKHLTDERKILKNHKILS